MNRETWLTSTDPRRMMDFLGRHVNARKLRLFFLACYQRLALRINGASHEEMEIAERFIAGTASLEELDSAYDSACTMSDMGSWMDDDPSGSLAQVLACVCSPEFDGNEAAVVIEHAGEAIAAQAVANDTAVDPEVARSSEFPFQADIVRCIFNPFCSPAFDPGLLTHTVRKLLQAAIEDRVKTGAELNPQRLCILADALEDAGCSDVEVLEHLRGPGPHVRGCWAIEFLRVVN